MELVDMGGSSRVEHVPVATNVHFFVLKSYDLNMNMSVRTFIWALACRVPSPNLLTLYYTLSIKYLQHHCSALVIMWQTEYQAMPPADQRTPFLSAAGHLRAPRGPYISSSGPWEDNNDRQSLMKMVIRGQDENSSTRSQFLEAALRKASP